MAEQQSLLNVPQTATTGNDFYTPASLFLALGLTFDLDVCAPPGGVPWIPAKRYLTLEDDGLSVPWEGRVWMNPPFSRQGPWVERFLDHRHGVALVSHSKSGWFQALWRSDAALVSLEGMEFRKPNGTANQVFMPLLLAGFGSECIAAIGKLGRVR